MNYTINEQDAEQFTKTVRMAAVEAASRIIARGDLTMLSSQQSAGSRTVELAKTLESYIRSGD